MDTPQGKMGPSPPKIGADSLKMAKVPWELAPQVKNYPAAEGSRQRVCYFKHQTASMGAFYFRELISMW